MCLFLIGYAAGAGMKTHLHLQFLRATYKSYAEHNLFSTPFPITSSVSNIPQDNSNVKNQE